MNYLMGNRLLITTGVPMPIGPLLDRHDIRVLRYSGWFDQINFEVLSKPEYF